MSTDMKCLGRKLRSRRKHRGLSQSAFGEMIGVSRQRISEIEGGRYFGRLTTYLRVVDALGLKLTLSAFERPTMDELDELFRED